VVDEGSTDQDPRGLCPSQSLTTSRVGNDHFPSVTFSICAVGVGATRQGGTCMDATMGGADSGNATVMLKMVY
jgi:hypothetical protein